MSKQKVYIAGVVSVLTGFFLIVGVTQAAGFSRVLKIGDVGDDVKELQKILNSQTETQIAVFGPGSPGSETRSFGKLTKDAVIRFQNLYFNDILRPAGLSRGTGFVGQGTLKKLGLLMAGDQPGSGQSTAGVKSDAAKDKPIINAIYPTRGGYGTMVTISGSGFNLSASNKLTFGFDVSPTVASIDGKTIIFQIPQQFSGLNFSQSEMVGIHPELPLGVMVGNSTGDSNVEVFTFTFYN